MPPILSGQALKDALRHCAREAGFDVMAVTTATLSPEVAAGLHAFVEDGRHGEMGWMEDTLDRRKHPQGMWPQAVSAITLAMSYAPGYDPLSLADQPDRGVISVYARNRDYHDLIKKRLKQVARWLHEAAGEEVKVFVDTAPLMEKPLAAQAGVGWQGKHTNLVSRRFGSWLFLGEILTTAPLPDDPPADNHCGRCTSCVDSCPTGALDRAHHIDARRCVSYLTIEHGGPIPHDLRPLLGNRIYGCDDCLAVCPWNKFAPPTQVSDFLPRMELMAPRLLDLAQLDEDSFRQMFAGSPIKRAGRRRVVRNVLIALGNAASQMDADTHRTCSQVIGSLLDDEEPLVRGAAIWALWRLDPVRTRAEAARLEAAEDNPDVLAEWAWVKGQGADASG